MKITEIEGIGPVNASKLAEQGIATTEALLRNAADASGRRHLAEETGISEKAILNWVNRADLMRVKGVGEEFSDLLGNSGVDTIRELRRRNPQNLYDRLQTVNQEQKLCRRAPALTEVEKWIEHAKSLEPVVTY